MATDTFHFASNKFESVSGAFSQGSVATADAIYTYTSFPMHEDQSVFEGQPVFLRLAPMACELRALKPGWVNIDLVACADLQLDMREAMPLPDKCAQMIYSEHFFEHIDYPR